MLNNEQSIIIIDLYHDYNTVIIHRDYWSEYHWFGNFKFDAHLSESLILFSANETSFVSNDNVKMIDYCYFFFIIILTSGQIWDCIIELGNCYSGKQED